MGKLEAGYGAGNWGVVAEDGLSTGPDRARAGGLGGSDRVKGRPGRSKTSAFLNVASPLHPVTLLQAVHMHVPNPNTLIQLV